MKKGIVHNTPATANAQIIQYFSISQFKITFCSLSLSLSLSVCHSLSLTHTHTHTHKRERAVTHIHIVRIKINPGYDLTEMSTLQAIHQKCSVANPRLRNFKAFY